MRLIELRDGIMYEISVMSGRGLVVRGVGVGLGGELKREDHGSEGDPPVFELKLGY